MYCNVKVEKIIRVRILRPPPWPKSICFAVFWLKSLFETILGKYKKGGGYRGFSRITVKLKKNSGQICPLADQNRVKEESSLVVCFYPYETAINSLILGQKYLYTLV